MLGAARQVHQFILHYFNLLFLPSSLSVVSSPALRPDTVSIQDEIISDSSLLLSLTRYSGDAARPTMLCSPPLSAIIKSHSVVLTLQAAGSRGWEVAPPT